MAHSLQAGGDEMKKLRWGCIGLGRLGYEHATNLAQNIPESELIAICAPNPNKLQRVAEELGVPKTYTRAEELCADPDLDAICIVSPSAFHVEQIELALRNGKHVFCEKPLGVDVQQCKRAEQLTQQYPNQKFTVGFMRRYDPSYLDVKARIDRGEIGKVVLVRSYTQDPISDIEETLEFAPRSGGQFLDMCVHDIDIVRWFTESEVRRLWAIGSVFEYERYRELGDGDNVCVTLQCENEAMGFLFAGRAAAHGCHVETEVIGTRGTLRIASVPAQNLVEVMNEYGVCRACYPNFIARWHQTFINELRAFSRCILEDTKPEITVEDGTAASAVAYRCKESFETGSMLSME